ncbi:ORF6N domain-containing protein, partial [Clostridioides difficile]|uniref:ORF6N domain-containing protein n=1 Tax=Clostridioides difficile TaxID=1496 RepID=UPI001F2C1DE9
MSNNLQVIERNNERVLTTQQLADVYETEIRNISNNFNNNKERFIEGKHYFCLQGDDLRTFKRDSYDIGIAPNVNKLYLWTERGANRHCKILDTDKAWEQFDNLE